MERDMKALVKRGYDRIKYDQAFRLNATLNPFEQHFLDTLYRRLPPAATVLDLGCGPGLPYDRYFADLGCRLTGVDFCRQHVEQACRNVPQATFVEGDITEYYFPPASFDAVVSFYAIFHVPRTEHQALFDRVHRMLKPNGLALLTLGARNSAYGREEDWLGAPMAWSMFAPEEYRDMLQSSGFCVVLEDFEGQPEDGEYHFWVLAGK